MSKGLKQLVDEAVSGNPAPVGSVSEPRIPDQTRAAAEDLIPVDISNEAQFQLSRMIRTWSGWRDAALVFDCPEVSPWAETRHDTRTFVVCPERLIRNPNRVLLTVTPFRLRQEAVLTGAMLHEAGHARHSLWLPRTKEQAAAHPEMMHHSDDSSHAGEPVTKQTVALARLMEEPRIEGLMARNAEDVGAADLAWTMRASAAKLIPTTNLSPDPDQRIMDLIDSWAKRAGRQLAISHWTDYRAPQWVSDFTTLLHSALENHIHQQGDAISPATAAAQAINHLLMMAVNVDDRGTYMLDTARDVLDILFPETAGDDSPGAPMPSTECGDPGDGEKQKGEGGESDEAGEQGEGNTEPEDEGEGTDPGAGDKGEEDPEADEEGDGSPEQGDDGVSEDSDTDEGSDRSDDSSETGDGSPSLEQMLAELEAQADSQTEDEGEKASKKVGGGAGFGGAGDNSGGFRQPTAEERLTQKGAEHFLRGLIDPSESSKVTLTDQPSATVDGAAMASWKAGGQRRDPRFFRRTQRTITPAPPVKIAILVDVSSSMDDLQEPSALISWALAAAAIDLRNFAGRGVQVESCLIHWGSDARVIQGVGEMLPGIRQVNCNEGTAASDEALALVEEQMPGFFDHQPTPVNRLLVNFTDWQLWSSPETPGYVTRAIDSGVNLLTVAPRHYTTQGSSLYQILKDIPNVGGKAPVMIYRQGSNPEQVWNVATELLNNRHASAGALAGF